MHLKVLQWQGNAGGIRQHNLSKETCSWNNWETRKGNTRNCFSTRNLSEDMKTGYDH